MRSDLEVLYMPQLLRIKNIETIKNTAKEFLNLFPGKKLFAFYGEMGAGKTTFIKALCEVLKTEDHTSSPTFSMINEYHTNAGEKIYHFDFYRIKNEGEAFDIGYEDYFYSNSYCFIEWPEKIENLIPENAVKVKITVNKNEREISFF